MGLNIKFTSPEETILNCIVVEQCVIYTPALPLDVLHEPVHAVCVSVNCTYETLWAG